MDDSQTESEVRSNNPKMNRAMDAYWCTYHTVTGGDLSQSWRCVKAAIEALGVKVVE